MSNNRESVNIFVHLLKRNIIKDKRYRIFNVMRNIHDTLLNKNNLYNMCIDYFLNGTI